jgi:hypothetical protein
MRRWVEQPQRARAKQTLLLVVLMRLPPEDARPIGRPPSATQPMAEALNMEAPKEDILKLHLRWTRENPRKDIFT